MGVSIKNSLIKNRKEIDYRLITSLYPDSPICESYRRIKVGLEFSSTDKPLKVIQITSASKGEGKSTTLFNLARTYVEDGKKVILIDFDLRRPRVHRAMRIENANGLVDYLVGDKDYKEFIQKSEHGFDFICSGSKSDFPTAMLNSEKTRELIKTLRNEYDIILLDCPPILAVSDAITVSKYADGCIFVVSQLTGDKQKTRDAVDTLRNANVNIVGTVFTEVYNKSSDGNYYYYYYYYYYYDDNNKKRRHKRHRH